MDLSDGVDYVRHNFVSEKDAPLGDFEPCDGSIRINLDEIWNLVRKENFGNPLEVASALYKDVLIHEMYHKWFTWGLDDDWTEMFNEMDERVMRIVTDWNELGIMTKQAMYDWKH